MSTKQHSATSKPDQPESTGPTDTRPCPHCDDGELTKTAQPTEYYCTTCYATNFQGGGTAPGEYATAAQRREHEHETYNNSGAVRLFGGYKRAYLSRITGDSEYAIDNYDSVTDGIWTPHKRDWRY